MATVITIMVIAMKAKVPPTNKILKERGRPAPSFLDLNGIITNKYR